MKIGCELTEKSAKFIPSGQCETESENLISYFGPRRINIIQLTRLTYKPQSRRKLGPELSTTWPAIPADGDPPYLSITPSPRSDIVSYREALVWWAGFVGWGFRPLIFDDGQVNPLTPRLLHPCHARSVYTISIRFITWTNFIDSWKWNKCLNIKMSKCLVLNWTNISQFHPLEVVGSETQLQVGYSLNY